MSITECVRHISSLIMDSVKKNDSITLNFSVTIHKGGLRFYKVATEKTFK